MATRFSERVSAIQGIGTAYQETLSGVGVSYLRDLLSLEPERLHALEPALPLASLREWRSAAWLLTLDDMTPDMAECLVAAGIANVSQLADAGLQTLERALQKSVEKNEFKDPPSLYGLAALQRDAAKRAASDAHKRAEESRKRAETQWRDRPILSDRTLQASQAPAGS